MNSYELEKIARQADRGSPPLQAAELVPFPLLVLGSFGRRLWRRRQERRHQAFVELQQRGRRPAR